MTESSKQSCHPVASKETMQGYKAWQNFPQKLLYFANGILDFPAFSYVTRLSANFAHIVYDPPSFTKTTQNIIDIQVFCWKYFQSYPVFFLHYIVGVAKPPD